MGWAVHPGGVLHKDGPDEAGPCVGVSIGTTGRRNYVISAWRRRFGGALTGPWKELRSIMDDEPHIISFVS